MLIRIVPINDINDYIRVLLFLSFWMEKILSGSKV